MFEKVKTDSGKLGWRIDLLWQATSCFMPCLKKKEKAVLEYTEAMTDSNLQVTDTMIERLKQFFDEEGIVELTGLIAFQNLSSKFNSVLDVPAQGFCKLLSASLAEGDRKSK